MRILAAPVLAVLAASSAGGAWAHEFWIEAQDWRIAPGEEIVADIKVGTEFEGSAYAYVPENFRRFDLATGGAVAPLEMRLGDRPAARAVVAEPGLATLIHVTRNYDLQWETWEQFVEFVEHKDAGWVIEAHAERGLGEEDRQEVYSRYAKALIAVGDGAGQDEARGLSVELVALENPYTGDMADGIDMRLLYRGEPRSDAQLEVFSMGPDGAVEIETVTTDGAGEATVPVAPGRTYLVDSVVLREPERSALLSGAQWESLWASLTFAVPE